MDVDVLGGEIGWRCSTLSCAAASGDGSIDRFSAAAKTSTHQRRDAVEPQTYQVEQGHLAMNHL